MAVLQALPGLWMHFTDQMAMGLPFSAMQAQDIVGPYREILDERKPWQIDRAERIHNSPAL